MTEKPRNVFTIAEVIDFATGAAAEAYNEVKAAGGQDSEAVEAAIVAYRCAFPALTSTGAVQAYLGLVVRGLEVGFLTHRESRLMVATARTWLAANAGLQAAKAAQR